MSLSEAKKELKEVGTSLNRTATHHRLGSNHTLSVMSQIITDLMDPDLTDDQRKELKERFNSHASDICCAVNTDSYCVRQRLSGPIGEKIRHASILVSRALAQK